MLDPPAVPGARPRSGPERDAGARDRRGRRAARAARRRVAPREGRRRRGRRGMRQRAARRSRRCGGTGRTCSFSTSRCRASTGSTSSPRFPNRDARTSSSSPRTTGTPCGRFEVHALDYLLKPIDDERFEEALRRAIRAIEREREGDIGGASRRSSASCRADPPAAGPRPLAHCYAVRERGKLVFVRHAEIDWIEAAGDYVRLHAGARSWLVRETMAAAERRLARGDSCASTARRSSTWTASGKCGRPTAATAPSSSTTRRS